MFLHPRTDWSQFLIKQKYAAWYNTSDFLSQNKYVGIVNNNKGIGRFLLSLFSICMPVEKKKKEGKMKIKRKLYFVIY